MYYNLWHNRLATAKGIKQITFKRIADYCPIKQKDKQLVDSLPWKRKCYIHLCVGSHVVKQKNSLSKPLYLNANLIYSEVLNLMKKPNWTRKIKTGGTLSKLKLEGYDLVTSALTRMEVMHQLRKEHKKTPSQARELYFNVLKEHNVWEITDFKELNVTAALLDHIGKSNLDFKDALHLLIAQKFDMPVCTHDKKACAGWSLHPAKEKFYDKVFKPEELIKAKKN